MATGVNSRAMSIHHTLRLRFEKVVTCPLPPLIQARLICQNRVNVHGNQNGKKEASAALAIEVRLLAGLLTRLAREAAERLLHDVGLRHWAQHATLALLRDGPLTSRELSYRLHLEPATLVPIVDALEVAGLLRRGQDPNDRRRMPLMITEQGLAVLERMPAVHPDDVLLKALNDLGEEKSRRLLQLMRELTLLVTQDESLVEDTRRTAQQLAARTCAQDELSSSPSAQTLQPQTQTVADDK